MKEIQTKNFLLRSFRESDLEDTHEITSNPKIAKHLDFKEHRSLQETEDCLKTCIREFPTYEAYWAIEQKSTNKIIGYVKTLHVCLKNKRINVIWGLDEKYWGQGISYEVLRAVIKYLVEEEPFELVSIEFYTDNELWSDILEKVGMKKDAVLRRRKLNSETGEWEDRIIYSIIKEEVNW